VLGSGHADGASLLGRFALVVILPLVVGVTVRTLRPSLERVDEARDGGAALVVAVLVYAALSGAHGAHHLGSALLASAIFLAASAAIAAAWWRLAGPGPAATPGAFAIAMRDFAVAAALASQAFGDRAATVPGVYGVVMLIGGSVAASAIARARRKNPVAGAGNGRLAP
jgi:bile acid:Na+ symporter, BASS family